MVNIKDLYSVLKILKKELPVDEGCSPFYIAEQGIPVGSICFKCRDEFLFYEFSDEDTDESPEVLAKEIIEQVTAYFVSKTDSSVTTIH